MDTSDQTPRLHERYSKRFGEFQKEAFPFPLSRLLKLGIDSAIQYAEVHPESSQVLGYYGDRDQKWPSTYISVEDDGYYLMIANQEYVDKDLAKLEAILFDWMVDEEYILISGYNQYA